MAVPISDNHDVVLKAKRELAECLSGYRLFCRDSLEDVVDYMIQKIDLIARSRSCTSLNGEVKSQIKTLVIDARLEAFKNMCLDNYYQRVLAPIDESKIKQLTAEVKRVGFVQEEASKKIIEGRAFRERQALANFVLVQADAWKPVLFRDIITELVGKNIFISIDETLVLGPDRSNLVPTCCAAGRTT